MVHDALSVSVCTTRSDYSQIVFVTTWNYTYTKRRNCMPKFYLSKGQLRSLFVNTVLILVSDRLQEV